MNLIGQRFRGFQAEDEPEKYMDLELKRVEYEIAYWRKHPNLHGFIVENFADGVDECQEIHLYEENINSIIEAIEADNLPETSGFFFGESCIEGEKESSLVAFRKANELLAAEKKDGYYHSVIYQASW